MTTYEYYEKIKEKYKTRGTSRLVTKSEIPTVAEIKNACLSFVDIPLSPYDDRIIQRYFKLDRNNVLTKKTVLDFLNSYSTISRFIDKKHENTKIEAVDLLALLIDFKPRPFDYKLLSENFHQLKDSSKQQYAELLQKLTYNFVGREFVFQRIKRFLVEKKSGYYYLIGNPGIGKSALAVKYATDNDYLLHIINHQSNGKNTEKHFIKNICTQIKERYDLAFDNFPIDYTQDGDFLEEVLIKSANCLTGTEKIVIVVDGIDELGNLTFFQNKNILHLPDTLPQGIFFLLTMRKITDDIQFPNKGLDGEEYTLEHNSKENEADISTYIEQVVKTEDIQEYLKKHGISEKEFIKALEEKSEGNFMYLTYVTKEISEGFYNDTNLQELPKGLEGYYKDHWERMMNVSDTMKEVKLKVLYVLGVLKNPASAELLTDIIKQDLESVKQFQVQEIINGWQQFFNKKEEIFDGIPTKTYSIYHKSFLDFLKEKELVEAVNFSFKEAEELQGKFLDYLEGDLFDGFNLDDFDS